MIFLHGGVICPAEIMALLASWPFLSAIWIFVSCRVAWWFKSRKEREFYRNMEVMDSEQFSHWREHERETKGGV